jgi:hypothetical protein
MAAAIKNSRSEFAHIEEKLDQLICLVACQITQGQKVTQAAPLLKRAGLSNAQIATVLGSTANAISARLGEAKAKKTKNDAVAPPTNSGL